MEPPGRSTSASRFELVSKQISAPVQHSKDDLMAFLAERAFEVSILAAAVRTCCIEGVRAHLLAQGRAVIKAVDTKLVIHECSCVQCLGCQEV